MKTIKAQAEGFTLEQAAEMFRRTLNLICDVPAPPMSVDAQKQLHDGLVQITRERFFKRTRAG